MNAKVRMMISIEKTGKVRKKGKLPFTVWGTILAVITSSAGFASVLHVPFLRNSVLLISQHPMKFEICDVLMVIISTETESVFCTYFLIMNY